MSFEGTCDLLAGLSYINAGLQCTNELIADKKSNNPSAWNKFFFNLGGSAMRIGMADNMARHGNFWGYSLNSMIPYTNTQANAMAFMNPFMGMGMGFGFNPMMPMMPMGGFGFWGGGCHHHCGGSYTSIQIRC